MNPGAFARPISTPVYSRSARRINTLYLDNSTPENCYRLETFRATGSISATASQQLRCYFVTKCRFPAERPPSSRTDGRTDIRSVSDPVFLEKASENTLEIYQEVIWMVESRYGPVMKVFEVEGSRERRLVIGYKMGGTSRFFRFAAVPNAVLGTKLLTVLFPISIITTSYTRPASMSSSSPMASRLYPCISIRCPTQPLLQSRARSSRS